MSDIFIFAFGCLVTLIVATAVGFLLWGANNEPLADDAKVAADDIPGPGDQSIRESLSPGVEAS